MVGEPNVCWAPANGAEDGVRSFCDADAVAFGDPDAVSAQYPEPYVYALADYHSELESGPNWNTVSVADPDSDANSVADFDGITEYVADFDPVTEYECERDRNIFADVDGDAVTDAHCDHNW